MFAVLLLISVWFICSYSYLSMRRPPNFPPGPQWYPIVGNFLQIRRKVRKYGRPYRVYEHWMKKYNSSVIGLKLGNEYTVVALSHSTINDVLKRAEFEGRPDNLMLRLRIGKESGERIGITSADGETWLNNRQFVIRHLKNLGMGRQKMEEQIQLELQELLRFLDENSGVPLWTGENLPLSVLNVLWTIAAGKKFSKSNERIEKCLQLMRKRDLALGLSGTFLSIMPLLRHIIPGYIHYDALKKFNVDIREFMQVVVDEHKAEYSDDKFSEDLIFAYLYEMKMGKRTDFSEDQLITIIMDLFIAGAVTTSNTLHFVIIALALHQDKQKLCHEQIDDVLRSTANPELSDKAQLSYIEAFILETQRLRNIIEVGGPRRTMKATTLGGYDLPRNTTVLIATQHSMEDKDYWKDPDVFRPERFLDDKEKIGNTDRMLTFGKGTRRCIGEALARSCLFTYITGILQKFRIELPEFSTLSLNDCDFGFTTMPKPYQVIFTRRC